MNNLPFLDLLINTLIQQYFLPSNGVILVSSSLHTNINIPSATPLININIKDNFSIISTMLSNNFGCQNFILNVKHPAEALQIFEEELAQNNNRFNSRKYIIISYTSHDVSEIIGTKEASFVNNILVVEIETISKLKSSLNPEMYETVGTLWTNQYLENRKNMQPYFLDKWFSKNSSFTKNINLFPNKLKNLHRRKVRVGTFDYAPYIVIDNSTGELVLLGSELKIISSFLKNINGTLEVVYQSDLWGDVFANGSSYGLRGNLIKDKFDIGAAALFLSAKAHKYFDYSNTYMRTELICLVPVPRLAALWFTPLYSFKSDTWVAIIITQTLIGITVFYINYFNSLMNQNRIERRILKSLLIQKTIESVARPMVSQNMSKKQFYAKPFLALVLLSSMVISVAYNSGFASIMTKPIYEAAIETLDDFLDSDIPWGGLQVADWITEWKNGKEGKHKKAAERYVAATEEELRQLSLQGNFAFKVERINDECHIDPYLKEDIVNKYQPMKEYMLIQNCVLIFKRNSVLVPEINKIISRLLQSGLISYWIREGANYRKSAFHKKLHHARIQSEISNRVKLTLNHVSGVFYLWLAGNITALVVFLTEILYKKYIALKLLKSPISRAF